MNLTKEQIKEIAKEFKQRAPHWQEPKEDFVVRILTKKFGEPNEPEEWPKINDSVFTISGYGEVEEFRWDDDNFCKLVISVGNLYRTKEAAENFVALRKHIQKFPFPKDREKYFRQVDDIWDQRRFFDADWIDKMTYEAGGIMPLSSTEADRTERIRLLKLCYS